MFASIARRCNVVVIVSSLLLSSFLIIITACGSTPTSSNPSTVSAPATTPASTPPTNVSNPLNSDAAKQVFTQMATAIKNMDYTTLYNLTSSEYQANHTQQQMISDIQTFVYPPKDSGVAITGFGIGQVDVTTREKDNATVANGSMSFDFANGDVNGINPSLIAENGEWKIVNLFYNQS